MKVYVMYMGVRERAECPVCHEVRALKKDGTFRAHGYSVAAWHGNVGEYCRGEGRRPTRNWREPPAVGTAGRIA